jgi:hypothetical protein
VARIQERINTNVPGAVIAKGISKLFQLSLPYLGWVGLLAAGFVMHAAFHSTSYIWLESVLTLVVAAFTRHLTHSRGVVGQWLAPITVLMAGGWLVLVDLHGIKPEIGLWFIVGGAMCIVWNIWTGVHENASTDGGLGFLKGAEKAGVEGIKLSNIRTYAHKILAVVHLVPGEMISEDLQGKARHIESGMQIPRGSILVTPHKDDASRANIILADPRALDGPIAYPGPSISQGGSMADPLRGGKWADGEEMFYNGTNTHVLANGCTGAGKTKSFAYNEMGETFTRFDAGVLAIDISKRRQFLGPMEPALHRFETTRDGACQLLQQVHFLVAERADFLGERGYEKWEKGCGLIHWTVWLEEAVDVLKLLDETDLYEDFESDVRNMRSAGMRLVLSLQRPTFDQIPPTVRAQLDYLCFGLKTGSDEAYALSDQQKAAECHPAEWRNKYPGKSYFDSYSLDEEHCIMENRWFTWGESTALIKAHCLQYPATARPADHLSAARLDLPLLDVAHLGQPAIVNPKDPASLPPQPARPGMKPLVAGQPEAPSQPAAQPPSHPASRPDIHLVRPQDGQPDRNGGQPMPRTANPPQEHQRPDWTPPSELPSAAPDPEYWEEDNGDDVSNEDLRAATADMDPPAPGSAFSQFDFGPDDDTDDDRQRGERWSPADARAAFEEALNEMRLKGVSSFTVADMIWLANKVGNQRGWVYKVCEEFCLAGVLRKRSGVWPQEYIINTRRVA